MVLGGVALVCCSAMVSGGVVWYVVQLLKPATQHSLRYVRQIIVWHRSDFVLMQNPLKFRMYYRLLKWADDLETIQPTLKQAV